jgi:DNA (cytosine-5)-methyltransferase 1
LPKIDAFAYGFPCNDFSLIGEQKGFSGKFGPLYSYGISVINFFKPKFFVAENVGGIRSANNGQAFKKILEDLENAGEGYNLSANLYRCEEYGIPQSRHRIVM